MAKRVFGMIQNVRKIGNKGKFGKLDNLRKIGKGGILLTHKHLKADIEEGLFLPSSTQTSAST